MEITKNIKQKNDTEADKYKTISILDSNKKQMESIGRKLSEYHKKKYFRMDKVLEFLLKIYDKIENKERYFKLINT